MAEPGAQQKELTLDEIIVKVTNMVSYDSIANKLAKQRGLNINYVSWEDCARNKQSSWGPCISDMSLRVNYSCMPVIRESNYTDKTCDVEMTKIPIVVGNQTINPNQQQSKLQTITLKHYLSNFSDYMTNNWYKSNGKHIDLTSQKENKDTHVIMSSQACFLPIQTGKKTRFNVALFNYQSQARNPAVLVIVSTSKGSSAQIIEGKEQYLLFNNQGKKADFTGERVSDLRRKKGQKNINDKQLSKQEKQDNVIVIVQVPLKRKEKDEWEGVFGDNDDDDDDWGDFDAPKGIEEKVNVEAAQIKIVDRTKPICICNKELVKLQVQYAYNGNTVGCDECGKKICNKQDIIYHCLDKKDSWKHKHGYDLCIECGEKQLKYDELRGLLHDNKDYILKRNEDYPIRVTLQYYKATDNGVVNNEIMNDMVKQLILIENQADFVGSLVNEYDVNRPSEWINPDDMKNDQYKEIRNALKQHCGKNWQIYMKNFENHEVNDGDLENLDDDDYKELIPKIGPRNRFKKWVKSR